MEMRGSHYSAVYSYASYNLFSVITSTSIIDIYKHILKQNKNNRTYYPEIFRAAIKSSELITSPNTPSSTLIDSSDHL